MKERKLTDIHNLLAFNPALAKEWHSDKNFPLTPKDVTPGSGRKVWWRCKKGHEWLASIDNRNKGRNCPFCSGRKVNSENSLQTVNPRLAQQWHPIKNGALTPSDITANSNSKVWWKCEKGHEWEAMVCSRNKGRNCIYCTNQAVNKENCLAKRNPLLAKEWHPIKNKGRTPSDVLPGTRKKAWWICKRGHEWEASIGSRNTGIGCPFCHSQTSQVELRIYAEMKYIFKNVFLRKKIDGIECDVYIPKYRIAIEFDGAFWHRNKLDKDKQKNILLSKREIVLIRVREKGLEKVSGNDVVYFRRQNMYELIMALLNTIMSLSAIGDEHKKKILAYFIHSKLSNDKEYYRLLEMLPSPLPGESLFVLNKKLSSEWNVRKNGKLTPKDVSIGSEQKVWWLCDKGHEWQADVAHRIAGTGCPFCSGKMVAADTCLQTLNPLLASQWNPNKNGLLNPRNVTCGTNRKVWWLCDKGHEWQASIANRNKGRGCPYCSSRKFVYEKSLQFLNPVLSKEWESIKNNELTPAKVFANSGKKVWWKCKSGHEWQARVADRNKGRGCPYCSHKKEELK